MDKVQRLVNCDYGVIKVANNGIKIPPSFLSSPSPTPTYFTFHFVLLTVWSLFLSVCAMAII